MKINLLKGINDIEFGTPKNLFIKKFSEELAFETIEEDETTTEASYIDSLDCTCYFTEEKNNLAFTTCETENTKAELFGEKIFNKTDSEIINLMKNNNFYEMETEDEGGEKVISFYDAAIDFFFDGKKLICVSWSIPI